MAKFVLTQPSYINDALRPAGEVVETDLRPGPHMEPYKDENGKEDRAARKAKDEAGKVQAAMPGDPKYVGDLIAHSIGDGSTLGRVESSSSHALTGSANVVVDGTGNVTGVK